MKQLFSFFLCIFCHVVSTSAQPTNVNTSGDNSPAVIAKNFSAVYGVRADAVEAILKIYEKDGLDPAQRKSRTESLLKKYQQAPEKKSRAPLLSDASKKDLGVSPALADALDWDLYAGSKYLTTTGANSPAVMAEGDVNIWYGIPPKALRALAERLEANKIEITDFEKKLFESVKNYEDLKAELQAYGSINPTIKEAETLLKEGKLLEVEKLLKTDFFLRQKGLAYQGYVLGKTEELLLKYDSAGYFYLAAVQNDPSNSKYLQAYAFNEYTRAHYDDAIIYYEKALAVDSIAFGTKHPKTAVQFNRLGLAWYEKGNYDRAIPFFEKALAIDTMPIRKNRAKSGDSFNNLGLAFWGKGDYDMAINFYYRALVIDTITFGNDHPDVARDYNNLGLVLTDKGEYDRAISCFEKALVIDSLIFGIQHPLVTLKFNNLGLAWSRKGEHDRAIALYQKALAIDTITLGKHHPAVARELSNLGVEWDYKGEYDRAIALYENALAIDSVALGNKHPIVAIRYINLGSAWQGKRDYDRAIACYGKALKIDSIAFGNKHPVVAIIYKKLGGVYHIKGEFDRAIAMFEKTVDIYEAVEDWVFSLPSLNIIGSMQKRLGHHEEGLAALEKGIARAQELDQKSGKQEHADIIRRMRYHSAGCLAGLGRKKEAEALYQQLLQEARETNDTRLLEDLKNDGWKE